MTEVLALGGGLFGLLEMPAAATAGAVDDHAVAVVLLNAGFIHRSGPYRMSTRLARSLREAGYPVLRFDAPGVGDGIVPGEQPVAELVSQVLDQLQVRTGCRQFVVGGLCSAADASWKAAQDDSRISGLILLDGVARGRMLGRLIRLRRLFRRPPSRWLAAMQRRLPSSWKHISPEHDQRTHPKMFELRVRRGALALLLPVGKSARVHAQALG